MPVPCLTLSLDWKGKLKIDRKEAQMTHDPIRVRKAKHLPGREFWRRTGAACVFYREVGPTSNFKALGGCSNHLHGVGARAAPLQAAQLVCSPGATAN